MSSKKKATAAFLKRISGKTEELGGFVTDSDIAECNFDEFVNIVKYCEASVALSNSLLYDFKGKNSFQVGKDMWSIFKNKKNLLSSLDVDFNPTCNEVLDDIIKDLFGDTWGEYKLQFDSENFSDSQLLSSLVLIDPDLKVHIYQGLKDRDIELSDLLEVNPQISIFLNRDFMSLKKVGELSRFPQFAAYTNEEDKHIFLQDLCLDALDLNPKTSEWLKDVKRDIKDVNGLGLEDSSFKKRCTHILFSIMRNNSKIWDSIEDSLDYAIKWHPDFGNRHAEGFNPLSTNMDMDIISNVRIKSQDRGKDANEDLFNSFIDLDSKNSTPLFQEFGYQILFGDVSWTNLKESISLSEKDTPIVHTFSDDQKIHIKKLQSHLKRSLLLDTGLLTERCESMIRVNSDVNPHKFLNHFGGLCLDSNIWGQFTDPDSPVNILKFMSEDGLIQFKEGVNQKDLDSISFLEGNIEVESTGEASLEGLNPIEFSDKDKTYCRELIHFDSVLFKSDSSIPTYIIQSLIDLYSSHHKMTNIEGRYGIREVLESLPDEVPSDSALSYFVGLLVTATEQSQCLEASTLSNYSPVCLAKFLTPTIGDLFQGKEAEVSNLITKIEDLSVDPSKNSSELKELMFVLSQSEIFKSSITKDQYKSLDELWGSDNGLVSKKYIDNPIGFTVPERESLQSLLDSPVGLAYLDIRAEPPMVDVIKAAAYYEENPSDCLSNTDYDLWSNFKDRLPNRIGIEGSVSVLCSESNSKGIPCSVVLDKKTFHDGVSFLEINKDIHGDIPNSLPNLEYPYDWFNPKSWSNGKGRMDAFETQIHNIISPGYTPKQLPGFLKVLGTMRPELNYLFKKASDIASFLFQENVKDPKVDLNLLKEGLYDLDIVESKTPDLGFAV